MTGFVIGSDAADVRRYGEGVMHWENGGLDVSAFLASHEDDWIVGTVDEAAARIARYAEVGRQGALPAAPRSRERRGARADRERARTAGDEALSSSGSAPAIDDKREETNGRPGQRAGGRTPSGAGGARVYDLSLPFNRDMPTYYFYKQGFDAPFFTIVSHPAISKPEDGYVTHVSFVTHMGTHVDAPLHVRPDGMSLDQIPVSCWLGEGPVIGIPKGAHEEITAEDLETSGMEVRPGDLGRDQHRLASMLCRPGDRSRARAHVSRERPRLVRRVGPLARRARRENGARSTPPRSTRRCTCPTATARSRAIACSSPRTSPALRASAGELDLVTGRRCLISCAPVKYEGGEAFPLRALAIPLS